MSNYTHLTPSERDQIAALKGAGLSIRAIAARLRRAGSTISRELKRNALESGAYRPVPAEGAYLLRRQRPARLEQDAQLRGYVLARLLEGWTPEQISGRLGKGIEIGLNLISTEAIYAWVYSKARKADALWRYLTRGRPRRGRRKRPSKDRIAEKVHISERTQAADQREEVGHWEADLVICKRTRPVLVLHERKTRLTLISRLMGKTAAETVSALMAMVKRLAPALRGSITFDNGGEFARHALLRDMLSGAAPLKWSTHRDSIYPIRGGSEDGRQARQTVRDRSEIAPGRSSARPRPVDSGCGPSDRRNAAAVLSMAQAVWRDGA